MSQEREQPLKRLTGVHISFVEKTVTLEIQGQGPLKLSLATEGIVFDASSPGPVQPHLDLPSEEGQEQGKRMTLSGKLKAKPKEGKPDRSGKPTAYARFSAHVEGEKEPHDFLATFHRHTTKIALTLSKDSQITVDGYPHPGNSEKRLDTFSVINIIQYPDKGRSQNKRERLIQPGVERE